MTAAAAISKFGFDRVFGTGGAPGATRDPAALQTRVEDLEAELAALRLAHEAELVRARGDGFEAGLTHARSERETAILAAVDALHAAVEGYAEEMDAATRSVSSDAAELALAAAELLAGQAVTAVPGRAIDDAIGRVLSQVRRGEQIQVKVNPALLQDMEARLAERQGKERRRLFITIVSDEAVAVGDAMISWEGGGLAVDAEARRTAVLDEFAPLLSRA